MDEQNPYRGPDAAVAEFSSGDELAGRGARLGAAIIDAIILMVIVMPLMYMGGYWTTAMAAAQAGEQVGLGTTLMWAVVGLVVFAIVQGIPLNASGQTWGKKVLKIKIVDMQGGKPPLGRLLGLRYFPVQLASNIPLLGPVVALVDVLMIFRNDRRCGHDLIAGTRVVHAD
ncbi:RDD family protein [Luteimonas mephitis]|uniref:RDD family protein n=1 Tax=Luteimonas mephitis TaxID=83615 RepID=UPI00040A8EA3|nr:RDD family protein [Luteimonas mephitis]